MNSDAFDSRDLQFQNYNTRRIDDIDTRLARLEGRMDLMATREDVANAKYSTMMAWIGIGIAVLVGKGRLELPRFAAHDPKSCSSTNSDTSPRAQVRRVSQLYAYPRLCVHASRRGNNTHSMSF